MSNMSYCRYQNTRTDFDVCVDDLEELMQGGGEDANGDPRDPLSDDEVRAMRELVTRVLDLAVMLAEGAGVDTGDLGEACSEDRIVQDLVTLNRACEAAKNAWRAARDAAGERA